jgi:hypothetical protein
MGFHEMVIGFHYWRDYHEYEGLSVNLSKTFETKLQTKIKCVKHIIKLTIPRKNKLIKQNNDLSTVYQPITKQYPSFCL